ncbi:hypothetical protein BT69DRAFT_1277826 [Atractiella rhizophila]|nr:hypothetical protein BT69DRAFT_1277826 [Atractiella rhizophila]
MEQTASGTINALPNEIFTEILELLHHLYLRDRRLKGSLVVSEMAPRLLSPLCRVQRKWLLVVRRLMFRSIGPLRGHETLAKILVLHPEWADWVKHLTLSIDYGTSSEALEDMMTVLFATKDAIEELRLFWHKTSKIVFPTFSKLKSFQLTSHLEQAFRGVFPSILPSSLSKIDLIILTLSSSEAELLTSIALKDLSFSFSVQFSGHGGNGPTPSFMLPSTLVALNATCTFFPRFYTPCGTLQFLQLTLAREVDIPALPSLVSLGIRGNGVNDNTRRPQIDFFATFPELHLSKDLKHLSVTFCEIRAPPSLLVDQLEAAGQTFSLTLVDCDFDWSSTRAWLTATMRTVHRLRIGENRIYHNFVGSRLDNEAEAAFFSIVFNPHITSLSLMRFKLQCKLPFRSAGHIVNLVSRCASLILLQIIPNESHVPALQGTRIRSLYLGLESRNFHLGTVDQLTGLKQLHIDYPVGSDAKDQEGMFKLGERKRDIVSRSTGGGELVWTQWNCAFYGPWIEEFLDRTSEYSQ